MIALAAVAALAAIITPPYTPATRIDLEHLVADNAIAQPVAPAWSQCPQLYAVALDNWPDAENDWPILDRVFFRESRCQPDVVNRYGCVGVMQICTGNFRRMAVNRTVLQDAAVNIATGWRLCQEWVRIGRSCWRPWWSGRWRP